MSAPDLNFIDSVYLAIATEKTTCISLRQGLGFRVQASVSFANNPLVIQRQHHTPIVRVPCDFFRKQKVANNITKGIDNLITNNTTNINTWDTNKRSASFRHFLSPRCSGRCSYSSVLELSTSGETPKGKRCRLDLSFSGSNNKVLVPPPESARYIYYLRTMQHIFAVKIQCYIFDGYASVKNLRLSCLSLQPLFMYMTYTVPYDYMKFDQKRQYGRYYYI